MYFQTGWKHFPFEEISLTPVHFSHSFNSLRIIQLSDLHLNTKVQVSYLEKLVLKVNEINPDLVLFTGDIIDSSAYKLKTHLETFKLIKAPSFYVTGNHDIVYGPRSLKKLLKRSGVVCLDNEILKVNINGETLQLVGLSDRYSFLRGIKRDVKTLFSKLDSNLFTILLAHQPKDIVHVDNYRIDIQLSGHTHGGQIYPFNLLVKHFQPYFSGLYTHNKTLLYVARGLGYWGVSVRYKAPSEIPVFTIN